MKTYQHSSDSEIKARIAKLQSKRERVACPFVDAEIYSEIEYLQDLIGG